MPSTNENVGICDSVRRLKLCVVHVLNVIILLIKFSRNILDMYCS